MRNRGSWAADRDAQRFAIEVEIETVWVELTGRTDLVELRLTQRGKILGLKGPTVHGDVIGSFTSAVPLDVFREAVFKTWEDMHRG